MASMETPISHRMVAIMTHCGDAWTAQEFPISMKRNTTSRDRMVARDRALIAPRSRLDRTAIAARLQRG